LAKIWPIHESGVSNLSLVPAFRTNDTWSGKFASFSSSSRYPSLSKRDLHFFPKTSSIDSKCRKLSHQTFQRSEMTTVYNK
ncbi:hypothetical protein T10_4599, partial [Trichinella papuae]